jgi:hypothetical protein
MRRHVSLACIGLALQAAACRREPSIEVINTSGATYLFSVFGDRDVFLTDTVASGSTHCWRVPEVARHQSVRVAASDLSATPRKSHDYTAAWTDSLLLDRSWRVQLHAPRYFEASEIWNSQRRTKEAEVANWYAKATAAYLRGASPATAGQIEDMRERMLEEGPIQPGAPHYEASADVSESNSC